VNRKYDAVIFDLFGTLVDNILPDQYHACLAETARVLLLDRKAFITCWVDEVFRGQRRTGVFPSSAAQIEHVCARFGIPPDPAMVEEAVQAQYRYFGLPSLAPRDDVPETLATLRRAGYRIGLISDCSWEVPELWEQTALAALIDVPIFSCAAGARKPDPRLYALALERLAVPPTRCLYVGDGSGLELTGARTAGMDAVLICMPHERDFVMQQSDPQHWQGQVIERIAEILALPGIAEDADALH